MNAEIPANVIVAVATVVATLITGMIAMVNLTLGKEQKVSEFRQAWIDGLRDDLSKLLSSLRFLAEVASSSALMPELAEQILPRTNEQLAELRVVASHTLVHIKLRLNPEEADHIELLRLLEIAFQRCLSTGPSTQHFHDAEQALDDAATYSRPVLKREWNVVKRGEPFFRRVRALAVPFIVALALGFAALILFSKFRYQS